MFPTADASLDHQVSTCLTIVGRHLSSFHELCATYVLCFDRNTSNLDSSVHQTCFQSSEVHHLCILAHCLCLSFWLANLTRVTRTTDLSHLHTMSVHIGFSLYFILLNDAAKEQWGICFSLVFLDEMCSSDFHCILWHHGIQYVSGNYNIMVYLLMKMLKMSPLLFGIHF